MASNLQPSRLHVSHQPNPRHPQMAIATVPRPQLHGGLVAQEGAEGLPFRASLEGDGGFIRTPPRDGHQPVSLGYYKLIATDTSEYTIMGVQR